MLMEVLIVLEILAFIFLALGVLPYKGDNLSGKLPFFNKAIFVLVSAVMFLILSLTNISFDYNYCFINQTTSNFLTNTTINTATCASYIIEDPGLSYFNLFMAILCFVLMIIISTFAVSSRHDGDRDMGDYEA